MIEQENQVIPEIVDLKFSKNRPKIFWKVLLALFILVGVIVFTLVFLITPHKVYQGDDELFQNKKIYLSEKLTYLIRSPQVGDRVVFLVDQNVGSFQQQYVGLIVSVWGPLGKGKTSYGIISRANSSSPWMVTGDKISSRIYFPSSSETLKEKIITNGAWKITPSPAPMQLPVSGSKEYNNVPLSSDWIKYEPKSKEYSFFHPSNLKEEANSYDGNVTFSLTDKSSEELRYLEVFVKKIVLKPGEDAGRVIYKDTGLSSVPTFQRVVIDNSISGFEITRSVDNFSRELKAVYLPRENSVYSISMRTPSPMKDLSYEENFERIIGSFKFAY